MLGPGRHGDRGGDGPPGGVDPAVGLPPGTFGQRRSASGEVLASVALTYGATTSARPVLPADLPAGRLLSVDGMPEGAPRYRVLAAPSRMGGLTVAAIPLREVDQTLHRLLLVETVVILGVLVVLGLLAGGLVRIGLLPLARMEQTAGAIAGGDLSHRVSTADPRTEVGRLGLALNRMLDRLDAAFAERRASEERLRRFIADASHELRTPLASIRGYAELFRIGAAREPAETERAMRRIEEEAARMGDSSRTCSRSPGWTSCVPRRARKSTSRGWPRTPSTTRAPPRPTATSPSGRRARRWSSATPTGSARSWPTCSATRWCTPRPARP